MKRETLASNRSRLAASAAGVLFIALVVGACMGSAAQKPPFILPFDPGSAGARVAAEFRVTEPLLYAAQLQYEFKEGHQPDRARAWRLAGGSVNEGPGKWSETGAALELRIVVSQRKAGVVSPLVSKVVRNPRVSSWGGHTLNATLVEFELDTGTYEISVESLQAAPAFHNEPVGVLVGRAYRGK